MRLLKVSIQTGDGMRFSEGIVLRAINSRHLVKVKGKESKRGQIPWSQQIPSSSYTWRKCTAQFVSHFGWNSTAEGFSFPEVNIGLFFINWTSKIRASTFLDRNLCLAVFDVPYDLVSCKYKTHDIFAIFGIQKCSTIQRTTDALWFHFFIVQKASHEHISGKYCVPIP